VANQSVFWTVFSGTLVYILGQIFLKLFIEPVHDLKKTIGMISHSLIERANVISNPGLLPKDVNDETSQELRKLASRLQSHLYLIPCYPAMAWIFRLPLRAGILAASKALIGLSNGVHESAYGVNASNVKRVCDSLRIYNEP
jgi:hypothetical protein